MSYIRRELLQALLQGKKNAPSPHPDVVPHARDLYARATIAGLLHVCWFYFIGDKIITGPGFGLFPFGVIALTFGLSYPRPEGGNRHSPWLLFLAIASAPSLFVLFDLHHSVCIHKPGYSGAACETRTDQLELLKIQLLYFMVAGPIAIAALFSLIGAFVRQKERVDKGARVTAGVRVFCWLSGIFIMLFGLGSILEQRFSISHRGQILNATGAAAVFSGVIYFVIGLVLFDFGCHGAIQKRFFSLFRLFK